VTDWSVLAAPCTQAQFAELVGITQQRVSELVGDGTLPRGATALQWLQAYCERLREQAAGRQGEEGGLDLVQERAALAREQRIGQAIKNAIAQGEFAPIGLLADVLGQASAAVVDRFDALPGLLRKACPDLPAEARDAIGGVIAAARNEWIRATAELVVRQLETVDDDESVDATGGGEEVEA
jgi:phage terminase Nu1 subunit (DNA packaging protein)